MVDLILRLRGVGTTLAPVGSIHPPGVLTEPFVGIQRPCWKVKVNAMRYPQNRWREGGELGARLHFQRCRHVQISPQAAKRADNGRPPGPPGKALR